MRGEGKCQMARIKDKDKDKDTPMEDITNDQ
jgi:hypothetical protein